jgi:hypothetical protein
MLRGTEQYLHSLSGHVDAVVHPKSQRVFCILQKTRYGVRLCAARTARLEVCLELLGLLVHAHQARLVFLLQKPTSNPQYAGKGTCCSKYILKQVRFQSRNKIIFKQVLKSWMVPRIGDEWQSIIPER